MTTTFMGISHIDEIILNYQWHRIPEDLDKYGGTSPGFYDLETIKDFALREMLGFNER